MCRHCVVFKRDRTVALEIIQCASFARGALVTLQVKRTA